MSDCLHCDINELVQKHLEQNEKVDVSEVAGKMVESLADLILSVPEAEQAKLIAFAMAQFGDIFLEKSGAGETETTH
jgi:hypothetical protein